MGNDMFSVNQFADTNTVGDEDIDYTDTLSAAQLLADEWQLERHRIVEIFRQHGRPKRWKAT